MTEHRAVARWLAPMMAAVSDWDEADVRWCAEVEEDLSALISAAPGGDADPDRRSQWLLAVRRRLAARHPVTNASVTRRVLRQTLIQFVCGFHDLDLRDAYGPGHGALILASGEPATRVHWNARLAAGELVGIAATEAHGGSRFREITTSAQRASGGRWTISGAKCWVSRLNEASGWVAFFRDPGGGLSAAVIDARSPGLHRELRRPAGLVGWSWGVLRLRGVPIDPDRDLLGGPGQGEELFRRHFAAFRPLVAATALGAAAGVHTRVAAALAGRLRSGGVRRVRDNALTLLGRTHAEVTAALLATFATSRLAENGAGLADLWARVGKAHAVETAHRAVNELVPLVGAAGFQADSPLAKARQDLVALLYADGIHDSLYRSGGTSLLVGIGEPPVTRADLDRAA